MRHADGASRYARRRRLKPGLAGAARLSLVGTEFLGFSSRQACIATPPSHAIRCASQVLNASTWGNVEAINQLVEARADLNVRDASGETALMLAAIGGHPATVQALLEAGADYAAADIEDGYTALMWAAREGHLDSVLKLLQAGASHAVADNVSASCEPISPLGPIMTH